MEQLSGTMYTCSLDEARNYPYDLAESSVALLLSVTEQAINAMTMGALGKLKASR